MAGAVRRRRPGDFMYPLVEGGGLNRGDSVCWGVWILSLPEDKGKGRGKSCSQGRLWAIIICPGPQRKSDNPHVSTVKDTEIIGIGQFSRREVCLICESVVHKKNNKNVEMLMFFTLGCDVHWYSTEHSVQMISSCGTLRSHEAACDLWWGLSNIPHPQKHARQQQEMMGKGFFFCQ